MVNRFKKYIKVYLFSFKKLLKYGKASPVIFFFCNIVQIATEVLDTFITGSFVASLVELVIEVPKVSFDNWQEILGFVLGTNALRYGLIKIALSLVNRVRNYIIEVISDKFYTDSWKLFNIDLAEKFSRLNLEEVESTNFLDLLNKVRNNWYYKFDEFYITTRDLISSLFGFIATGLIIWQHNPTWFFIILAFVIPEGILLIILAAVDQKRIDQDTVDNVISDYSLTTLLDTRSVEEKRVDGIFKLFKRKYIDTMENIGSRYLKFAGKRSFLRLVFNLFSMGCLFFYQIKVIVQTITARLSVSNGIYLFGFLDYFWNKANTLFLQLVGFFTLNGYLEYFYDLENLPTMHEQSTGNRKMPTKNLSLSLVDFSFNYPNSDKEVLQRVNFSTQPNEKILFLGKDGSGKSSIIKVLTGLYKIKTGDIQINGTSIKDFAPGELKNSISAVFDDFGRYYYSIRDNIMLGDIGKPFSVQKYKKALEVTLLDEWMEESNISDQTLLGKINDDGIEIPSGHWQRIALARAVYGDGAIFLLDEAFTYIDSDTKRKIMRRLSEYWKNKLVIVIDEDDGILKYFDRVFLLSGGKLKEITKSTKSSIWG
ncbi:ATP-binding cassette domain-containing protein [Candidatus Dojkabacteria bacterium]|nr:ATP-binding cassette domain-containing protein [Candidatus Dojkabacteria bacterium]